MRREQSIPRTGNSSSNQPEEWNFFYAVISWRRRAVYDDAKDIDDDLSDKASATIYKVEEDGQCRKGNVLKGVYNPGD